MLSRLRNKWSLSSLEFCTSLTSTSTSKTAWRSAWWDSNALRTGSKTTLSVVSLANSVFLGSSLRILCCLTLLNSWKVLNDWDGSGDDEGSVLLSIWEWGVGFFLAGTAVGLADLGELGVGDWAQQLLLEHLSFLAEALVHTSAQSWQLREDAGALGEFVLRNSCNSLQITPCSTRRLTTTWFTSTFLCELLWLDLGKFVSNLSACEGTSEESEKENSLLHCCYWFIIIELWQSIYSHACY